MPIPQNAFTTSGPVRRLRRFVRHHARPAGQDLLASMRAGLLRGARSNDPDYFVAGVNKAGTTALQQYLVGHADVGEPMRKEVHYLDEFPGRSREWFRAHFWGDHSSTWGEATPEYFELDGAAQRLDSMFPDSRVIVCLRDPFARAVSHFHNGVDHATEDRSIVDAFAAEAARLSDGRFTHDPTELRSAYLQRSIYGRSLKAWREAFGERLLVLRMERLADDLPAVLRHLGLDPDRAAASLPHANARHYQRPPDELRELLHPFLRPDAEQLLRSAGWDEWPVEWSHL